MVTALISVMDNNDGIKIRNLEQHISTMTDPYLFARKSGRLKTVAELQTCIFSVVLFGSSAIRLF